MLAFLSRALGGELLDFEVPSAYRGVRRRGYKVLAAALRYRADYLDWPGHDRALEDAAVLRRVAWGLRAARWEEELPPRMRAKYDAEVAFIKHLLEESAPSWDPGRSRYVPTAPLTLERRRLQDDPVCAPFVRAARAQLRDEYSGRPLGNWSGGGVSRRARQLRKELDGGLQPLESRLRDLVRKARQRGELPPRTAVNTVTSPNVGGLERVTWEEFRR